MVDKIMIYMLCGLFIIGMLVLFFSVRLYLRRKDSRKWIKDTAIITKSSIKEKQAKYVRLSELYSFDVEYKYVVNRQEYIGTKFSFNTLASMDYADIYRYSNQYKVGDEIDFYYNFSNPCESVIDTKYRVSLGNLMGIWVGLYMVCISSSIFLFFDFITSFQNFIEVFFYVFMGGSFLISLRWAKIKKLKKNKNPIWQEIEATIIKLSIKTEIRRSDTSDKELYFPEIMYEYYIDGNKYIANRNKYSCKCYRQTDANKMLLSYNEGDKVKAYYNEKDYYDSMILDEKNANNFAQHKRLAKINFVFVIIVVIIFYIIYKNSLD